MNEIVEMLTRQSHQLEAVGDLIQSEARELRRTVEGLVSRLVNGSSDDDTTELERAGQDLGSLYSDLHKVADGITRVRNSL